MLQVNLVCHLLIPTNRVGQLNDLLRHVSFSLALLIRQSRHCDGDASRISLLRKAIASLAQSFQGQLLACPDLMVPKETTDPVSAAEERARFARFRARANIRLDDFV